MSLAAVVLAGGRSERMGTPKALLDFRGRPFIVRILEGVEVLGLKPRLVVLGPDAPRVRPALAPHECVIVENPEVEPGPIGSLRAALGALRPWQPAAMLAWPVDLPHVRLATVQRLIEAYRRTAAPAVIPAFAGRRGHPVIWGRSVFHELETSEAATRHGAFAVLHTVTNFVSVTVDDPAVIDDINTPADYERLVREANRDMY